MDFLAQLICDGFYICGVSDHARRQQDEQFGAFVLIIRVSERLKVTSIVVTHDTRSMRRVGKRILYMRNGKIYVDGTPEEIFSSTDPVVHQFVNGIADLKEHDF